METGDIILIFSFVIPVIVIGSILYFLRRRSKKQLDYANDLSQKISKAAPASAK